MKRKLIIDGNAVYEVDEDCMLGKRLSENREKVLKENRQEYRNQKSKD